MIFDFKLNRIIFGVGLGLMFGLTLVLVVVWDASIWNIFLVALLFIVIMNFLMKRIANNAYRHVHQLLFLHCDAKSYLNHVEALYERGSRARKVFTGVKLQNLCMAHVFTGDFAKANELNHELLDTFKEILDKNASMMFSQTMIDALIHLFDYSPGRFNEAYEALKEEVDKLRPQSKQYVIENPYSVFYMINRAIHLMAAEKLDQDALEKELQEANEFLRTCILYVLLKQEKIPVSFKDRFTRQPSNNLFYLDTEKIY